MARDILTAEKMKVLDYEQFDKVMCDVEVGVLREVPRMFQIWACKQVLGIAGTDEMQAQYTTNHDHHCPSCHEDK